MTREEYRELQEMYMNSTKRPYNEVVNHSYEKLLALKDMYKILLVLGYSREAAMVQCGHNTGSPLWKAIGKFQDVKDLRTLLYEFKKDNRREVKKYTPQEREKLLLAML